MIAIRLTFKPTKTTMDFRSLKLAAVGIGVAKNTVRAWLNGTRGVPPYIALERISYRPDIEGLPIGNSK